MNIKNTFLKLTNRTYPDGTETSLLPFLPKFLKRDAFGNLYHQIGETSVMFTSHLDTATSTITPVKHVIDGEFIKTDGTTILGADDKAGVTIMLYMIKNKVPGLYYFFLGEEVGCIGSRSVSNLHRTAKMENIKKVISFDRRDYASVITHQMGSRCCSDVFADALTVELNLASEKETTVNRKFNYRKDSGGIYTDSAQFTNIYPECTNIAVGYFSEHSHSERQNIVHLEKLAKSCVFVDWENLPVQRDPSKREYGYSSYGYGYDDIYDDYNDNRNTAIVKHTVSYTEGYKKEYYKTNSEDEENIVFYDEEYNFTSVITINKKTGVVSKYDVSENRLLDESIEIEKMLAELELVYKKIKWDGTILKIEFSEGSETVTCREELITYLPEFEFWKKNKEVVKQMDEIFIGIKEELNQLIGI